MIICTCGTSMKHIGTMTVTAPTTGGSYNTPIYECPNCGTQAVNPNQPSQDCGCPKCGADCYVKIARDASGTITVRCLSCGHDGSMTNQQYYPDLFPNDPQV